MPSTNRPVLPVELWHEIGLYLHVYNLLSLGMVSRLCREAASAILRHPHICGFRLVATPKEILCCSSVPRFSLVAAVFSAVRACTPAAVVFGHSWTRGENSEVTIPLAKDSKRLPLSVPFSAEKMDIVRRKCLCGDRKHDRAERLGEKTASIFKLLV